MNKLVNKVLTIDSREVAEMMEVEHKYILRYIEGSKDVTGILPTLIGEGLNSTNYFIESIYKDSLNRTKKCYLCTKMGCELLGNKQQGKKGILFTAKYVERFNEMQEELKQQSKPQLPTTYLEALKELVAAEEEKQRLIEDKNKLIHQGKLYTTSEVAKELGLRSARELNKLLEDKKIQYKQNGTWLLYSKYADEGLTSIKQQVLDSGKIIYDRKWNGKGRDFILNLFK